MFRPGAGVVATETTLDGVARRVCRGHKLETREPAVADGREGMRQVKGPGDGNAPPWLSAEPLSPL